jgi:hypothetical protein
MSHGYVDVPIISSTFRARLTAEAEQNHMMTDAERIREIIDEVVPKLVLARRIALASVDRPTLFAHDEIADALTDLDNAVAWLR